MSKNIVSMMSIADQLHINPRTIRHFIAHNNIPMVQTRPRILLDLNDRHPFIQSMKQALIMKQHIFYTLSDIAVLLNICPQTALKYLTAYDIPIQNQHKRAYVYLIDFIEFCSHQETLSSSFEKHFAGKYTK
jgi:hypothetical protein